MQIIIASLISDEFSYNLITIKHLNLKLFICVGIPQVLKFEFRKFRILKILNSHPCTLLLALTLGDTTHLVFLNRYMYTLVVRIKDASFV